MTAPPFDRFGRLDQLRAEIAMLCAERDRRTEATPRLDALIQAKRTTLEKLTEVAEDLNRPATRRRRSHTHRRIGR